MFEDYLKICECPVCLEDKFTIILDKCNHLLCPKCYSQLRELSCPLCRGNAQKYSIPKPSNGSIKYILNSLDNIMEFIKEIKILKWGSTEFIITLSEEIVNYVEKYPHEFKIKLFNVFNFTTTQRLRLEISHDLKDNDMMFRMIKFDINSIFYEKYLAEQLYNTASKLGIIEIADMKLKSIDNNKIKPYIHPIETKITLASDHEISLLEYHILINGIKSIEQIWNLLNTVLYSQYYDYGIDKIASKLLIIKYYHKTLKLRVELKDDLDETEQRYFELSPEKLLTEFNELFGPYDIKSEATKMYRIIKQYRSISKADLLKYCDRYSNYSKKILKYVLSHYDYNIKIDKETNIITYYHN